MGRNDVHADLGIFINIRGKVNCSLLFNVHWLCKELDGKLKAKGEQ